MGKADTETSGDVKAPGEAKAPADAKTSADVKAPAEAKTPAAVKTSADVQAPAEAKAPAEAPAAPPPRGIDALGAVAFAAYILIGGMFVFGFGRTLTSAVQTQNETPCRSLAPRQARLTGTVLDQAGNPVPKAEVVPVFDGRAGRPMAVRPDGTFSVFMPKGPQAVRVRAPGKAELEADLRFEPSQVVDVEVRLGKAADAKSGAAAGSLTETGRTVWDAPDFTVKDLEGNEVRLSDFRGKLVVLNFWATWCEPCITEWPQVAKLARRLEEDGADEVVVIALSIDQEPQRIGPFLELMTLFESPVKVLSDETTKLHEQFGSEKIPDTFFVDEQGRVSAVFVNVREWGSPDALHCVESSVGG
jgi:peroxiredoxin